MRTAFLASLVALSLAAQAPPTPKELYGTFRDLFDEDKPGADAALAALEKAAPGDPLAKDARKRFDAPLKTQPGLAAPAKGKYVLLEFWATWCPYCVAELPAVHRAWARFKGPRFDILSFSLDKKAADVAPFRATKQPMPWKHAFLPGAKANPVAEAYGAAGIPKYVLVGPDGRILAADASLRGENLEATLAKFLKD
jgi:thiol-disulfide isomerase/thioredoxin